jgi:hypothetical protein
MFQNFASFFDSVLLCNGSISGAEVDDQGFFDTEDGI